MVRIFAHNRERGENPRQLTNYCKSYETLMAPLGIRNPGKASGLGMKLSARRPAMHKYKPFGEGSFAAEHNLRFCVSVFWYSLSELCGKATFAVFIL